ncbi:hypothetical protein ABZ890_47225 [Streptomyces sp. NPDC046984]|uniref:hypothetical protein n=1 Tax=Streptomyces sp. NPDC046984 TaxID=3155138 RepID=UPI00340FB417
MSLSRSFVHAGERVYFRGTGFTRRQLVVAQLQSHTVVLGHFRARLNGTVTGTVTIPRKTHPGWHTFRLVARNPLRTATAAIKVLPSRRHGHDDGRSGPRPSDDRAGLASTGSEKALVIGGTATALLAIGGGSLLAARRRTS